MIASASYNLEAVQFKYPNQCTVWYGAIRPDDVLNVQLQSYLL